MMDLLNVNQNNLYPILKNGKNNLRLRGAVVPRSPLFQWII